MKSILLTLAFNFLAIPFFPALIPPHAIANECPGLANVKRMYIAVSVSGDMGISAQKIKNSATKALRRRLPNIKIAESRLEALHSPIFRITVMGASHETKSGIWLGSGSTSLKTELLWVAKPTAWTEGNSKSPPANREECPILLGILWEADPHLLTGQISRVKRMLHRVLESDIRKFSAAFRALNPPN